MKERVRELLKQDVEMPLIGTFHSIGARILRTEAESAGLERSFSILDNDDSLSLIKKLMKSSGVDDKKIHPRAVLAGISLAKTSFLDSEAYKSLAQSPLEIVIADIYFQYEREKLKTNSVDFDDLIVLPVKLFEEYPTILEKYRRRWQYISVDEYQDTNAVQFKFLNLLCHDHRNLCVIGDSDQSIYSFRGADITNILDFQKHFPDSKIVKLEQNYRSTKNILDAADGVIKNNVSRVPKKMWTESGEGELVEIIDCHDEREEAEIIFSTIKDLVRIEGRKYSDFAILVRMNAQSRVLEESALRHAIPYQILGGLKFYARKEIRDVLAYLKFIANPLDDVSLLRIINLPPRKIGATTIAHLGHYAQERGISIGEVLAHIEFAEGIAPAAKTALASFLAKTVAFRKNLTTTPPSELIRNIIDAFELEAFYRDKTEEGETRYENVLELQSVAQRFDHSISETAVADFLEEVALISDADSIESADRLIIMTLHMSKGLEFPVVFIPGLEEGILPHSRSLYDPEALEEERRLVYVGMTRAMEKLTLLRAKSRMVFGEIQSNPESRFLSEIPTRCTARPNDGPTNAANSDEWTYSAIEDEITFSQLTAGDRVRHAIFGPGSVLDVRGDLATIAFDTVGKKRLALSIAPLEKIS